MTGKIIETKNGKTILHGNVNGKDTDVKQRISSITKKILFVLPFLLGLIGYLQVGEMSLSSVVYHSIKLYGMSVSVAEDKMNIWLDVARWIAPAATITAVFLALRTVAERVKYAFRTRKANSCSVYGNGKQAEILLQNLGNIGIRGNADMPYHSKYHIVMMEDMGRTVEFLERFPKKVLEDSHMILCLNAISPMVVQKEHITGFSIEESCAGNYWKTFRPEYGERIAVIGDGSLADAIMVKGLLLNIFALDQGLEYHLYSRTDDFRRQHGELENAARAACDKIFWHGGSYAADYEALSDMDRVILCMDEGENIIAAAKLLELAPMKNLHLYSSDPVGIVQLFGADDQKCIKSFGGAQGLLTYENVVREGLLRTAKAINRHYQKKYGGEEWEDLSVFKRKSNLSAAEYFPTIRELAANGKTKEELSHLEHIRWVRFHWLNNWHYGEVRDNARRIHTDLQPYEALDEPTKQKDTENVELALSMGE